EESNVDLAQQFTDLVIGQRAFQANARTVSVSDEMLQELVNLI
ncbi:MAG: flagellar basal body rod C-terminal domain-containing protein, partial [Planctomycetota bacterium]